VNTEVEESISVLETDWRLLLKNAVRTVEDLSRKLGFESLPSQWYEARDFPIRVPEPYLSRIKKKDLTDPLLLQVVPHVAESRQVVGFSPDPLLESKSMIGQGVLQKYQGRVLLITTSACAVNCRYCFRRSFPYAENVVAPSSTSLGSIESDSSIKEVILSGGDPLILSDKQLGRLFEQLDSIKHLDRIRIHTRLPVVIPQRVTAGLRELLRGLSKKVIFVLHFNHPAEIDSEVSLALKMLADDKHILLNQSVLLKGVNDSPEVLASLSEKLFESRVLPYYLNMLDRVEGTAHFEVSEQQAVRIYRKLQAQLSGYLVPKLVREIPGAKSKELQPLQLSRSTKGTSPF